MAASFLHFSFIVFLVFASMLFSSSGASRVNTKTHPILLPIYKDIPTKQYYTKLDMGSNPVHKLDLIINLGGQSLWYNCHSLYNSSTYRPVPCNSKNCQIAKGSGCVGCNGPFKPGCTNDTCGMLIDNPHVDLLFSAGLGEDVLGVKDTIKMPHFLSTCAEAEGFSESFLDGLPKGAQGMAGLARTQISLPTQLASAYKLPNEFSLCLPSSNKASNLGGLLIGGQTYNIPNSHIDISKSLVKTPLVINPVSTARAYTEGEPSDEYFIEVKGIKVDGKAVNIKPSLFPIDKKGNGGTKLSTMNAYTALQSSIFKALVRDFVKKSSAMKIKKVAQVAPFGACFDSRTIANTITGPAVPAIELVFQKAKWTIYGANSMVKVKENVLCLGFIDGGKKPRTSIVIGGLQLEDNLLELDLTSSMLGFTSSLLVKNISCSHFKAF